MGLLSQLNSVLKSIIVYRSKIAHGMSTRDSTDLNKEEDAIHCNYKLTAMSFTHDVPFIFLTVSHMQKKKIKIKYLRKAHYNAKFLIILPHSAV